jgi:hypothetical protein
MLRAEAVGTECLSRLGEDAALLERPDADAVDPTAENHPVAERRPAREPTVRSRSAARAALPGAARVARRQAALRAQMQPVRATLRQLSEFQLERLVRPALREGLQAERPHADACSVPPQAC